MTFVSYAQNFEDVLLWRALKGVERGFYIDVGAWLPDTDSVTRAFYDRGWSGVNVEPSSAAADRLLAARPRDVTLTVAVAATSGEATLFELPGTGLSTLEPGPASRLTSLGFDPVGSTVATRTLADICREHVRGPVHFLKIDVEGAEAAVLRGADFAACRPWIVVVEATAPMSTETTHAGWEPLLLEASYRFVWFDGLNRFYVEAERYDALAPAFATPPNVFDDFVRAADSDLARRIAEAEGGRALASAEALLAGSRAQSSARRLLDAARATGAARVLAAERGATATWLRTMLDQAQDLAGRMRDEQAWLRDQLNHQRHQADERASQLVARAEEVAWLRGCLAASDGALAAMTRERDGLDVRLHAIAVEVGAASQREQELAAIKSSTSWRVTAPLRWLRGAVAAQVPPTSADLVAITADPAPPPAPALPPAPIAPLAPEPVVIAAPEPVATEIAPDLVAFVPSASPIAAPRKVHVVHQFHSGSAVGDAVTNAMLLLRGLLRAAGFESDIFVEHRDPALADTLHTIDALPRHDGYVLLAHHSMGYGAFDRIMALPARKVLVYHNITPPAFLAHMPGVQRYASIGRTQLATWRDHATAALALSEFNALELRGLGFDAVRTCALLFDIDALRRRAAGRHIQHDGGPFTVLFVGRVTPSKAQDDLLVAFARFCGRYPKPCRLVLVGAFDADQSEYLDRLDEIMLDQGLTDRVVLTGLVPDEELHDWYRRADLYVSLSHHEGFGVPLVEAMVHGVPVLAWPAGAVPYTLAGAAPLLTSRDPDDVAERLLTLALDPQARQAIAARQAATLDRFALARQMPILTEALALAGAQPPAAAHASLAANLCLAVSGHVNKTYSLAAVNRRLAAVFEAQRPGRARLLPVEGEPTDRLDEVPDGDRDWVATLAARPAAISGPELVISQHYPVHVPLHRGDLALALVFWEESLAPAATVAVLNAGFDGVLAPSAYVARLLVDSGVALPVINVGLAPDLAAFAALCDRPTRAAFTFLHVSSGFPRKGLDALLTAWRRAFRAADGVRLVIKTFPNRHNDAGAQIAALRAADPDAAPIEHVDDDLDASAQCALFAAADAMVLPSRGEGYNLPAAEAMAAGLPVIVTDVGGHRDFCGPATARLVRSRPAASGSHLATPFSMWREPDIEDLAMALLETRAGTPPGQIAAARAAIAAHADPACFVERLASAAAALILARPIRPARIAWMTSWDVRCGVASYASALFEAMPREGIGRMAILCDDRTPGDGDAVRACWTLGAERGVTGLIEAALGEDADVTLIQHQPAFLPWGRLAELLAALIGEGRAVVATLHNTLHLLDVPAPEREQAVVALGSIARILVHTIADLERLAELGLHATVLPHAAPAAAPPRPVRSLPPGSTPVIGCYGFFLPGKGIGPLIDAVAALRSRWPGIRLRLVNAEYGHESSAQEIALCRAAAAAHGLGVDWHLDYLPHAGSSALLAGCDLIVLPYAASKEGSSAALRSAMASGVPVAVTPIALFDEARAAVARLGGGTVADLVDGLAGLLADPARRRAVADAAHCWLADHAVTGVATRLAGLLRGLAAADQIGAPLDGTAFNPDRAKSSMTRS